MDDMSLPAFWWVNQGTSDEEYIYALLRTTIDPASEGQKWRGDELMAQVERFESDRRHKPVENVGRTSPYPRILPLREVLKARW